ncbi:MAG: NAD(P)-dependent oxidoreductase [Candidatus Eisenbacteria bacterium]
MAKTRLSAEELARNFADLHPPYTRDEAALEASRCLFCFDAPCTRACPTGIDVPRFIRQILHDNPAGGAETILEENVFGGSCARACPTEVLCEGACVDRALHGGPVRIGRLQRYATDHAMERGLRFFEPGPESGKRVAVIGAGPAGLSSAHELRRMGHAVTVFDARDLPGGLNTIGISPYKISTEFALAEVDWTEPMGVGLRLGAAVDGAMLAKLLREYDAVFLGVGLGPTIPLGIPGEDSNGVWEALDFIFQAHTGPYRSCEVGRRVVVIGGGNTAVDVATQAVRLGAEEVVIAYRRSREEMPAFAYEYELAVADGVLFEWFALPSEFVTKGGALEGVRFRRARPEGSGRSAKLVPVPGSDFVIPCDMAVKALGQSPALDLLSGLEGIRIEKGRVLVDPKTGRTGVPGLYAGGDCVSLGAEIVNAVQEGKIAARAMDRSWREPER